MSMSASGDGRVNLSIRITAEQRKRLRSLALARDTTLQDLIEQAVSRLIRSEGRK